MIRDITIGQYYPGDSWIHRLDPRSKIIITLIYIVQIFFAKDFLGFAAVVIALAVTIGISKVPVNFIFRGLKPILLIILFTFVINMFMIDGRVLVKLGFLTITREGLYTAFFMAVRLILLIIGSSMLAEMPTLLSVVLAPSARSARLLQPAAVHNRSDATH